MRDSVRAAFFGFSNDLEGHVDFMYLDVRGLVTTGIGNLIDPMGAALALPWMHAGGIPATRAEIAAEWIVIKGHTELELHGGGAFRAIATLHLEEAAITQLVLERVAIDEAHLRAHFPEYDAWCADAQLGMLSMSWAVGPDAFPGRWPRFSAAASRQDWSTCAAECHIDTVGNAGVARRNAANIALFMNAARVGALGAAADPDVLYWPGAPAGGTSENGPSTVPEGPAAA